MNDGVETMNPDVLLSIGAIAKATGVPVETLRTWERRYGYPDPVRMPSGHRRYPASVVNKIKLMAAAKEHGLRPAESATLTIAELRSALGLDPVTGSEAPGEWRIDQWLAVIRRMDGDTFDAQLMREWARLGAIGVFEQVLGPLLTDVGNAWQIGAITVAEEHWASERIRDSLASHWRPMAARNAGPVIVCASLPGEQHDLGLQMAAVIVSMHGGQPVFLGASTPLDGIAETAQACDAVAVLVSVSSATEQAVARPLTTSLRAALPNSIHLIAGGAGAVAVPGATVMQSWETLIKYISDGTRH